jgi:hypothetical protein
VNEKKKKTNKTKQNKTKQNKTKQNKTKQKKKQNKTKQSIQQPTTKRPVHHSQAQQRTLHSETQKRQKTATQPDSKRQNPLTKARLFEMSIANNELLLLASTTRTQWSERETMELAVRPTCIRRRPPKEPLPPTA